jgi:rubrerythrin
MRILLVVLVLAAVAALPLTAAPAPTGKVLENMQAAYEGESNAHARYLAFAIQADREGYGEVASLFRAAARAEEIHANNHAVVIRGLGAIPVARVDGPVVGTTRDNLITAIQGETDERDHMYPDYIAEARAEGNANAVRTLTWAWEAEKDHAILCAMALLNLEQLKGTKAVEYYVCPGCGHTMTRAQAADCPTCYTKKEKLERVS